MSTETACRRVIQNHKTACNRFRESAREVNKIGRRGTDEVGLRRAEAKMAIHSQAVFASGGWVIKAITKLVEERGIEDLGFEAFAVADAGIIWLVATPEDDRPSVLISLPVERIVTIS